MIFLADFPKPLHGMSKINESFYKSSLKEGFEVFKINSCPSSLSYFFGTKIWFFIKFLYFPFIVVKLLYALVFFKNNEVVYRSINGGFGQIYDFLIIMILTIFRKRIFIHHHSFSYLNNYSRLFNYICKVSPFAVHIVLGEAMMLKISEMYGIPRDRIFKLSNLAFFDNNLVHKDNSNYTDKIRIGHLSNLSFEKGLRVVVEHCKYAISKGYNVELHIAGPPSSIAIRNYLEEVVANYEWITYKGSLYGSSKDKFFKDINIFYFPSNYSNEAEPLVIYEAAQYNNFLIGTSKGCMADVLNELDGDVIIYDDASAFVSAIDRKLNNINKRLLVSSTENSLETMQQKARESLKSLFEIIADKDNAKAR